MNIEKLARSVSLLVMAAGLALGSVSAVNAAAKKASANAVLATVGSMKITEAQVDEKARPQLAAIESQVNRAKKRALDDIIDDYLIEQAARKAGMTKEAYLKQEVQDKAPAPTEKEMKDFYDQNQARIRQPFDRIKAPLENYMRRQKMNAARAELVAKLRQEAGVKVMLKAPASWRNFATSSARNSWRNCAR